jgi:hypothetical protein
MKLHYLILIILFEFIILQDTSLMVPSTTAIGKYKSIYFLKENVTDYLAQNNLFKLSNIIITSEKLYYYPKYSFSIKDNLIFLDEVCNCKIFFKLSNKRICIGKVWK